MLTQAGRVCGLRRGRRGGKGEGLAIRSRTTELAQYDAYLASASCAGWAGEGDM